MSFAPYPGLPLIAAVSADGTYGPFIQGNIGTFNQRKSAMFTTSGNFSGAQVEVLYSKTADSDTMPLLDECNQPVVLTEPTRKDVKNLEGGLYLWLVVSGVTLGSEITVSLGLDNPSGFLGDTDTTVGVC